MSFALLPGMALRGPLHPDADTAREWLRQELLRREYRPNLVQRMQEWFQELLDEGAGRRRQSSEGSATRCCSG